MKKEELKQDLKRGEICEHCGREQVDEDGACAWCCYEISELERFNAELEREAPNYSDFDMNIIEKHFA